MKTITTLKPRLFLYFNRDGSHSLRTEHVASFLFLQIPPPDALNQETYDGLRKVARVSFVASDGVARFGGKNLAESIKRMLLKQSEREERRKPKLVPILATRGSKVGVVIGLRVRANNRTLFTSRGPCFRVKAAQVMEMILRGAKINPPKPNPRKGRTGVNRAPNG